MGIVNKIKKEGMKNVSVAKWARSSRSGLAKHYLFRAVC